MTLDLVVGLIPISVLTLTTLLVAPDRAWTAMARTWRTL